MHLRQRVVDAVHAGSSCRAAAARFGVGVSSAIGWVARERTSGDPTPDKRGGNVNCRSVGHVFPSGDHRISTTFADTIRSISPLLHDNADSEGKSRLIGLASSGHHVIPSLSPVKLSASR